MSTTPTQMGAYTIVQELGRGGMGVVYLAKDPRLDRHVAIKVLPDEVAQDPERLARFEREARLLASMKHPNIGSIHGLEEADGKRFLVLEYLEGETLSKRLDGGPLRVTEAINVCRQIASALEAAHESGIIHRDLKPGNVMLTDDDEAKVLDFGLARGDGTGASSSSDLSASPTITAGATAAGVILGTAAYMSPEQARGRGVDRRTDIWSFGCVLYECLTGKQLFGGETVSDTIAKILEREPDWDALPKDTPERVRELLRRCLEKKARERLRDIGDARIELEEVASGKTSSVSAITAGVPVAEHKRKMLLAWVAAALAASVAIVMTGLVVGRPNAPAQPSTTLQITLPPGLSLFTGAMNHAISPDGKLIAITAADSLGTVRLHLREIGSLDVTPIAGTEGAYTPFWSRDSRNICYFDGSKLSVVSVDDQQTEAIANVSGGRGGSWGEEYIIFAGAQGPIYKVPIEGGDIEAVTVVDTASGETAHRYPEFLPDGKRFMYAVLPPISGRVRVMVSDLDGAAPKELMPALGRPVYVDSGHLIWQRGRRLMAQAFDLNNLELRGKPQPIGPAPPREFAVGVPPISASRGGTIVERTPAFTTTRLEWEDYRGRTLERLDLEDRLYYGPEISPDGRYVLLGIAESPEDNSVWMLDLDRKTLNRVTPPGSSTGAALWSPDGRRILYVSDHEGPMKLYVKSVDEPNTEDLIIPTDAMFMNPRGWTADGRYVLFSQAGEGTALDLWLARVGGEQDESRPFLATAYDEDACRVSRNGRWVAYVSNESGRNEIYVTSFPVAGRKYRISTDGGFGPRWSHDDAILFYFSGNWIMRVDVDAGQSFRSGSPRRAAMIPDGFYGAALSPVEPKWLVVFDSTPSVDPTLTVVSNWQAELRE